MNRWATAVTINLWPYALRFANDAFNAVPGIKTSETPLESFSGTPVRPQVLNFHPPFCPVYVLHNGLQGGGKRQQMDPQVTNDHLPRFLATPCKISGSGFEPSYRVCFTAIPPEVR
jgi:hypothetical protein